MNKRNYRSQVFSYTERTSELIFHMQLVKVTFKKSNTLNVKFVFKNTKTLFVYPLVVRVLSYENRRLRDFRLLYIGNGLKFDKK